MDVEKRELIFVRLPERSNDGDAVLSVTPLCASLEKEYKPFYYHLGLLPFSLVEVLIFLISSFEGC